MDSRWHGIYIPTFGGPVCDTENKMANRILAELSRDRHLPAIVDFRSVAATEVYSVNTFDTYHLVQPLQIELVREGMLCLRLMVPVSSDTIQ